MRTPFLPTSRLRSTIRFLMGLALGLTGLADMTSAIVSKLNWDILLGTWPVDVLHGTPKLTVVVGFFLVMLSYGLMRGKRQAWSIAVLLLLLSAFLHILRGGSLLSSIVAITLVTLLLVLFRYFQARSDPPSVRRGYIALLTGLSIVICYTVGGFIALYNQFEAVLDRFSFEEVLVRLLTSTSSHLHLAHGTQAFVFGHALPLLCLSAVLYGIVQILHPVAATLLPDEQEKEQATTLTRLYGTNSISYFALDVDKAYFFSSTGKTVLSYVLEGNVAVVAGDPIGPEEEMLSAMQEFLAFCQEQDWTTVFWQVRDTLSDLYRTIGLHALKIGEDAIISTHTFTLSGKAMANVRSSAKRAEKEGLRVVFSHGQVEDAEQLIQMEMISRTWLANKGGAEKGFSMGHFDMHENNTEQIYAVAVDHANKVHAFVSFVPIYGRHGWGLDLMRRAEQAAPGSMELLLSRSIDYLKNAGAEMVSLGLAPLSNVNETEGTFLGTSIDFLTSHFGNPDNNHSLFNFKKKFQPCWESRYLVYSSTLTLPKVGWALYRAHQRDALLLAVIYKTLKGWLGVQLAQRRPVLAGEASVHAATGGLKA
jgi:phosphatidylglycerol lysyltransferase